MPAFHFRLQTLLDRRLDEQKRAEEDLANRQKELAFEQQTLKGLEDEVARIVALYESRRSERLAGAVRASTLSNQTDFLLALQLEIQDAQSAVTSQQVFVEQAQEAVTEANEKLAACRREVDLLENFREKAEQRFQREAAYREELEQDEIGNVMYLNKRGSGENF
jgi:flagellar export protein FliJ